MPMTSDEAATARQGLPTKVVTDWPASEAEKRPAVTAISVPAASLELEVVTYGVTDAGQPLPATKKETCAAPPPFTTTIATVASDMLVNATTRGTVTEAFAAPLTSTR